jgi:hypothetical protein
MYNIFAGLALLSLLGLVIGLIRPGWLRAPSRLHVMAIFSTGALVFFFLFAITSPSRIIPAQSPNTASTTLEAVPVAVKPAPPQTKSTTANVPATAFASLNADDRRQAFTRALADELVARNNIAILRAWAKAQKTAAPEFASAATLRENIRRASNDFAFYKDEQVFGTLYVEVTQAEGGDDVLDAVLKRFEAK